MPMPTQDTIQQLRDVVQEVRRKPYPIKDLIPLLTRAADALEATLTPLPLHPNDATQVDLWAEIHRLRVAMKGPDSFPTWYEAAVDERIRRVAAERKLKKLQKDHPEIYAKIAE